MLTRLLVVVAFGFVCFSSVTAFEANTATEAALARLMQVPVDITNNVGSLVPPFDCLIGITLPDPVAEERARTALLAAREEAAGVAQGVGEVAAGLVGDSVLLARGVRYAFTFIILFLTPMTTVLAILALVLNVKRILPHVAAVGSVLLSSPMWMLCGIHLPLTVVFQIVNSETSRLAGADLADPATWISLGGVTPAAQVAPLVGLYQQFPYVAPPRFRTAPPTAGAAELALVPAVIPFMAPLIPWAPAPPEILANAPTPASVLSVPAATTPQYATRPPQTILASPALISAAVMARIAGGIGHTPARVVPTLPIIVPAISDGPIAINTAPHVPPSQWFTQGAWGDTSTPGRLPGGAAPGTPAAIGEVDDNGLDLPVHSVADDVQRRITPLFGACRGLSRVRASALAAALMIHRDAMQAICSHLEQMNCDSTHPLTSTPPYFCSGAPIPRESCTFMADPVDVLSAIQFQSITMAECADSYVTPTPFPTTTVTLTKSSSVTPTTTSTVTPIPTGTPSPTVSGTTTRAPTDTRSVTRSHTRSHTPTVTRLASRTHTPTRSHTRTVRAIKSVTPVKPPAPPPVVPPSTHPTTPATPQPTVTVEPLPTATPTPTPHYDTPSPTATPRPPTPTRTHTATGTIVTVTPLVIGVPPRTSSVTLTTRTIVPPPATPLPRTRSTSPTRVRVATPTRTPPYAETDTRTASPTYLRSLTPAHTVSPSHSTTHTRPTTHTASRTGTYLRTHTRAPTETATPTLPPPPPPPPAMVTPWEDETLGIGPCAGVEGVNSERRETSRRLILWAHSARAALGVIASIVQADPVAETEFGLRVPSAARLLDGGATPRAAKQNTYGYMRRENARGIDADDSVASAMGSVATRLRAAWAAVVGGGAPTAEAEAEPVSGQVRLGLGTHVRGSGGTQQRANATHREAKTTRRVSRSQMETMFSSAAAVLTHWPHLSSVGDVAPYAAHATAVAAVASRATQRRIGHAAAARRRAKAADAARKGSAAGSALREVVERDVDEAVPVRAPRGAVFLDDYENAVCPSVLPSLVGARSDPNTTACDVISFNAPAPTLSWVSKARYAPRSPTASQTSPIYDFNVGGSVRAAAAALYNVAATYAPAPPGSFALPPTLRGLAAARVDGVADGGARGGAMRSAVDEEEDASMFDLEDRLLARLGVSAGGTSPSTCRIRDTEWMRGNGPAVKVPCICYAPAYGVTCEWLREPMEIAADAAGATASSLIRLQTTLVILSTALVVLAVGSLGGSKRFLAHAKTAEALHAHERRMIRWRFTPVVAARAGKDVIKEIAPSLAEWKELEKTRLDGRPSVQCMCIPFAAIFPELGAPRSHTGSWNCAEGQPPPDTPVDPPLDDPAQRAAPLMDTSGCPLHALGVHPVECEGMAPGGLGYDGSDSRFLNIDSVPKVEVVTKTSFDEIDDAQPSMVRRGSLVARNVNRSELAIRVLARSTPEQVSAAAGVADADSECSAMSGCWTVPYASSDSSDPDCEQTYVLAPEHRAALRRHLRRSSKFAKFAFRGLGYDGLDAEADDEAPEVPHHVPHEGEDDEEEYDPDTGEVLPHYMRLQRVVQHIRASEPALVPELNKGIHGPYGLGLLAALGAVEHSIKEREAAHRKHLERKALKNAQRQRHVRRALACRAELERRLKECDDSRAADVSLEHVDRVVKYEEEVRAGDNDIPRLPPFGKAALAAVKGMLAGLGHPDARHAAARREVRARWREELAALRKDRKAMVTPPPPPGLEGVKARALAAATRIIGGPHGVRGHGASHVPVYGTQPVAGDWASSWLIPGPAFSHLMRQRLEEAKERDRLNGILIQQRRFYVERGCVSVDESYGRDLVEADEAAQFGKMSIAFTTAQLAGTVTTETSTRRALEQLALSTLDSLAARCGTSLKDWLATTQRELRAGLDRSVLRVKTARDSLQGTIARKEARARDATTAETISEQRTARLDVTRLSARAEAIHKEVVAATQALEDAYTKLTRFEAAQRLPISPDPRLVTEQAPTSDTLVGTMSMDISGADSSPRSPRSTTVVVDDDDDDESAPDDPAAARGSGAVDITQEAIQSFAPAVPLRAGTSSMRLPAPASEQLES